MNFNTIAIAATLAFSANAFLSIPESGKAVYCIEEDAATGMVAKHKLHQDRDENGELEDVTYGSVMRGFNAETVLTFGLYLEDPAGVEQDAQPDVHLGRWKTDKNGNQAFRQSVPDNQQIQSD